MPASDNDVPRRPRSAVPAPSRPTQRTEPPSPASDALSSSAWKTLLDQHPDGVIVSMDAGIRYANAAAATLLGATTVEALVGESVFSFVPRSKHQLMQQHRFLVECGEVPPPLDVLLPLSDTPHRTVRLRSTPVRIDGRYAMHTVLQDITPQRAREKSLREEKNHAEQMNRLKSRFLAQMSHEIRTPLTTVIGFAEILNENDLGTWNEFTTYIERSSQRLLRTINSVLNLSRLETGALELDPTRININATVQGAIELFRHRAAGKSVHLQVEVPQPTLYARFDEKALDRILDNLIGNAIKFTKEGGRVTVRVQQRRDRLFIEVEDTGVGIAPQFIPHLFEAFKQGDAEAPDDQPGSGLGLAITHQLVELMGGSIEVESETGVGSRFTVDLPFTPA